MEYSNSGFTFIIAILATSITISSQANVFDSKRAEIANCFLPAGGFSIAPTCVSTPSIFITNFTNCQFARAAAVAGSPKPHLYGGVTDESKYTEEQVEEMCIGENFVCCVYLEADKNPCPVTLQPEFNLNGLGPNQYTITRIHCHV